MGDMVTYLLDATKLRRANPRDDVLSELATVTIDGDNLSDDELAMFLVQLLVAGNETTRNMLSAGLVAFADYPDQWRRLRDEPDLVRSAVEELLRYTTPVIYFMRTATRDAVLGGQQIAEGEPLTLLFASADRDEAVFGPTAGELDVGRDPNPHVAFGFGNHFCLGATLARLDEGSYSRSCYRGSLQSKEPAPSSAALLRSSQGPGEPSSVFHKKSVFPKSSVFLIYLAAVAASSMPANRSSAALRRVGTCSVGTSTGL
jgi:hypothetical protein